MTDNNKQAAQPKYGLVKPNDASFNATGVAPIPSTPENWENRVLGADERYVSVSAANLAEVDSALGLVTVMLRMTESNVEKLEKLAKAEGLILQAYIRSVLNKEINKD